MIERETIRRLLIPSRRRKPKSIESGLYHYMHEAGDGFTRFHLRIEPDGSGMLLANATAAARLTPSGVVIAKGLLDGHDEKEIASSLKGRFRGASNAQINQDVERIAGLISNLDAPGDNYPILNFEDAAISPFNARLMAPLQADLPLAGPEILSPILDKLWDAAIPHVTLIVPENPDASDLIRAVERAEDLGMIAGVRSRATDLRTGQLVGDLAQAGIDHITIFYSSVDQSIHDSLFGDGDHTAARELFAETPQYEVATVAEIPLLSITIDRLSDSVESLIDLDVRNFSFFAIATPDEGLDGKPDDSLLAMALPQVADIVEELANQLDVRFVWQPPILRDESISFNEQVKLGPRSSGDVSIRVEPNGDVIPSRGPYRKAGNILTDSWDEIWRDPAFRRYRERIEQPTRCEDCPGLVICAADCPRKLAGWSQGSEGISI